MKRNVSDALWILCLPMLVAGGCGGMESAQCSTLEQRVLAQNEETPDGTRVDEVMAEFGSLPTGLDIHWISGKSNAHGASGVMDLYITPTGGEVVYRVTKQTGDAEINLGCGTTLSVPVAVAIETTGGELAEHFESIAVRNLRRRESRIDHEFASFGDLDGSLRPTLENASGSLTLMVFAGQSRGFISANQVFRDRDAVGERSDMIGYWGDIVPPEEG